MSMNNKLIIVLTTIVALSTGCHNMAERNPYDEDYFDSIRNTRAKGADLGWLSEMEHDSVLFYDSDMKSADCMQLLKQLGMNAVRYRVWVNPPGGWSSKEDVIAQCIRAHRQGLRIMIDFHYSDFFADPAKQTKPAEWTEYSFEKLKEAVALHTTDVLQTLKDSCVDVEWVQIGNETRNGMLWQDGKLWEDTITIPEGWDKLAALANSGYNAAKAVFPNAKVGVHVDNAFTDNTWWWEHFNKAGGKFDIIYLSHYPQTQDTVPWQRMNTLCADNVQHLAELFGCKVIISEIGTRADQPDTAAQVMSDYINKMAALECYDGVFYWEPEVYGGWKPAVYDTYGWGSYHMGAMTDNGQPGKALEILFR